MQHIYAWVIYATGPCEYIKVNLNLHSTIYQARQDAYTSGLISKKEGYAYNMRVVIY